MGRTEVFSAISQTCVTRRLLPPPERLNLLGKGTGQSRLWFMWETQTHVYNKKSAVLLLTSSVSLIRLFIISGRQPLASYLITSAAKANRLEERCQTFKKEQNLEGREFNHHLKNNKKGFLITQLRTCLALWLHLPFRLNANRSLF